MRAKCICIFYRYQRGTIAHERLLSIMYVLANIPVNHIWGDLVLKGNILEVSFQILPTEYAKEDMLSGFGSSLNCAIHPRAYMKLLSLLRNNENLCTCCSLLSAVFRKKFCSFPSETKGEDQRVQTISNSFKFRCMTLSKETPHNGSRSNKG